MVVYDYVIMIKQALPALSSDGEGQGRGGSRTR